MSSDRKSPFTKCLGLPTEPLFLAMTLNKGMEPAWCYRKLIHRRGEEEKEEEEGGGGRRKERKRE